MRYRRAAHTAWRTIADETVVLDLEAKRMHGLNPTAAFVWQTLEAMEDLGAMGTAMAIVPVSRNTGKYSAPWASPSPAA